MPAVLFFDSERIHTDKLIVRASSVVGTSSPEFFGESDFLRGCVGHDYLRIVVVYQPTPC